MKTGINLISPSQKKTFHGKRLIYASVGTFSLVFLTAIVLLSYRLFLNAKLGNLTEEETAQTQKINALQEKKVKFLIIHDRLASIQKLLKGRDDVNNKISIVKNVIPNDVVISALDGDPEEVTLSVESESLESLNNLIEEKIMQIQTTNKKAIKRIEMKSFRLIPERLTYSATFLVEFL